MYIPEIVELPGENKVQFPDGKESVLVSFKKDSLDVGLLSENKSNIFNLEVSTTGHSYNVDYKNKSPYIKISNYIGKTFVDGPMSSNTSFEELSILAYEFVITGNNLTNMYKKSFPLSRISSLESYLNGLAKNVITVLVLSGDDNKLNEANFNLVFKKLLKSSIEFAKREYQISQRWLGVWNSGSLLYENFKNYSLSFKPTTTNDVVLNVTFENLGNTESGLLTNLSSYGFTVNKITENVIGENVICTISKDSIDSIWFKESL